MTCRHLNIFDSRDVWHSHIISAAGRAGLSAKRITGLDDIVDGVGFIRTHPAHLAEHISLDAALRERMPMVQDREQVEVYENKTEQWLRWGDHMPETWLYHTIESAMSYDGGFPVMSKANEGASSVNVRFIKSRDEYEAHVREAFGPGISVSRCTGNSYTKQIGYLFLQRFIPHDRTYRVNIIGNRMAIFERFNYPDKPMAQTGNTNGVKQFTALHDSLIDYAGMIGHNIGSKWVALDILRDGDEWRLIETSLAWPWTTKDYQDVPFIGGGYWGELWDVLFAELDAGSFGFICQ